VAACFGEEFFDVPVCDGAAAVLDPEREDPVLKTEVEADPDGAVAVLVPDREDPVLGTEVEADPAAAAAVEVPSSTAKDDMVYVEVLSEAPLQIAWPEEKVQS